MQEFLYNVYVDPAAYGKMYAHIRFLAQVSVPAAERLYDALNQAIKALKENPESCPSYTPQKPITATLRYKLCAKRYRIVFETVGNAVYVYDIQDCRQDADKRFI